GDEALVQALLVALADALGVGSGQGLQFTDEFGGVVVGVVTLNQLRPVVRQQGLLVFVVPVVAFVLFLLGIAVVGVVVHVRGVALLVQESNSFPGRNLNDGVIAVKYISEDLDSLFAFGCKIVNKCGQVPPFRKSGGHWFGVAGGTNRLTVRSDDVEEEVHLVQHAILPGATKNSTRAEAVNGCGLDSCGRGVPNSTGQHGLHVLEDGGVISADGQHLEGPKCKSRLSLAGFELDTLAKGANEVI